MRLSLAITAVLLAVPASAQTDLALMTKPWSTGTPVDAGGGVAFIPTEVDDASGTDLDLTVVQVAGRLRPDREVDHAFTLGYQVSHLDLDTSDPALPDRLHSSEVAVGAILGGFEAFDQQWKWGGSVGVGHASSSPFGDGNGDYALASVFATTQTDDRSTLMLGVDFDGNRAVFPDLPLPAVTYQTRYSDQLTVILGFPVNRLIWTPDDRWTVQLGAAGIAFDAKATYQLSDGFDVFLGYGGDGEGFHVADDDGDRRLFYTAQKIEGGVEIEVCPNASLVVAGGFAFDQEFERGFDLRDTDTVRELDDAGYVRVGGRLTF